MTRAELVERVYQRHGGMSRHEAQDLVDLILRLISERLAAGERVEIANFGSFELSIAPPRQGRHPVTGRPFQVAGRRQLVFRPSRHLRERVNAAAEAAGDTPS